MIEPRCFISYSWESKSHKDWVRYLAEQLQANGIFVHLDQWDIALGDDLPHYMETSIRDSNYVLLVCTPSFAQKANSGKGGVGYEKSIATGEIFEMSAPNTKYVPLIKSGSPEESLPSYLKSKAYEDFRDNGNFSENLENLLRHLHKAPQHIRPPVGSKPLFENRDKLDTIAIETINTSNKLRHDSLSSFQERFDFARTSLGYAKGYAEEWARKNHKI